MPDRDERYKAEIRQLDSLGTYAKVILNDIESIKLRVEMAGKLDFDDRVRLRGVVAEFNLMFRNFYEPVIMNIPGGRDGE